MIAATEIRKKIEEVTDWAIAMRREFHQHPELGNEEFRTIDRIEVELKAMGISTQRLLPTGLVGMLVGGGSGEKVVAIRADVDALPMQEVQPLPFASTTPGVMHACGHDAHAAILLGTAKVLAGLKDQIPGTIKFFFQPAEETTGGAERMIQAGCMENPKVHAVLGLHVAPAIHGGSVGIKYDNMMAASDMLRIVVRGAKSHGAYPENGIDAIVASAQVIQAIQTIVSRTVSPLDSAVITIGKIQGGTAMNIIADEVVLEGTVRSLSPQIRSLIKKRIVQAAQQAAEALGATAEVEFFKGYEATINDNQVVDLIREIAEEELGKEKVVIKQRPSMGVEDFGYFLQQAPGAFFEVGSGHPDRELGEIHTDQFLLDEECIPTGITIEVLSCLKLLTQ